MSKKNLRTHIEALIKELNLTPKSIMASIYGDMLVPLGGSVWLGSLVKLAKCFGINEPLARTTALRLGYDGWLHPTRVGKYSYYSMSEEHTQRITNYYPRIYEAPQTDWTGRFYFLLTGTSDLKGKEHDELRQELLWFGAGQVAPRVFIIASRDLPEIEQFLANRNLLASVQVMVAESALNQDPKLLKVLAAKAWDTETLSKEYQSFLDRFRPLWQILERTEKDIEPGYAFVIRTLLITEFRKLALRDPRLPAELLPQPWSGDNAFNLCRSIYKAVLRPSENYLRTAVRTVDGTLPDTPEEVYNRFAGVK